MVGKISKTRPELRKFLKKLTKIKTWQLILVLILLLFTTATCLRFDHIKMTELKDAVLAADEKGDDGEISKSLEELKEFTFSHTIINVVERNGDSYITFGTGPFYLEKQYLRKTSAILEQAAANPTTDANPNGNVYAAAMSVCQPQAQANGWAWNNPDYINCYLTEINKYPTSERIEDSVVLSLPDTSLYRFDFASPLITPTLSGFFIVVSLILAIIIIIRILIWAFVRIALLVVK